MGIAPFYVYELIDPRDGAVFYVGKGVRSRVHHHERDAAKGTPGAKCDLIRDIIAGNLKVKHRIVARFEKDADAYKFEAQHIASIGLVNLTNISPGGGGTVASIYTHPHDKHLANELGKLARKTANFTWFPAFVRLGNVMYAMGACNALFLAEAFAKLVTRRGAEWVAKFSRLSISNPLLAARA